MKDKENFETENRCGLAEIDENQMKNFRGSKTAFRALKKNFRGSKMNFSGIKMCFKLRQIQTFKKN